MTPLRKLEQFFTLNIEAVAAASARGFAAGMKDRDTLGDRAAARRNRKNVRLPKPLRKMKRQGYGALRPVVRCSAGMLSAAKSFPVSPFLFEPSSVEQMKEIRLKEPAIEKNIEHMFIFQMQNRTKKFRRTATRDIARSRQKSAMAFLNTILANLS